MEAPNATQLNPYLMFDGNCEAAINFYQSVLGGRADFNRYEGGPMKVPDSHKNRIMHVTFSFDGCTLLASDTTDENPVNMGNNVHLSVYLSDKERAKAAFNALGKGGQETMPFQEVFWGGSFGTFIDKFGVNWMISCP